MAPLRYFAFSVEPLFKNLRVPPPKEGMGRFPPPGELKLPGGSNTPTPSGRRIPSLHIPFGGNIGIIDYFYHKIAGFKYNALYPHVLVFLIEIRVQDLRFTSQ